MEQLEREELTQPVSTKEEVYGATSPELTKWQMDLFEIRKQVEATLRGKAIKYEYDKELGIPIPYLEDIPDAKPVFSEYGIQRTLETFDMFLNKNTFWSVLSPSEIRRIFVEHHNLQVLKYLAEKDKYGAPSHKAIAVLREISILLYIGLKRALYGRESELISKIERRETITPQRERGGIFSWISGMFK